MPSAALNSLGIFFVGHFCVQAAQPVHTFSSMPRAFLRIVALKFPMKPSSFSSSEYV